MSATIESDELHFDIIDLISCVAIFYEKWKSMKSGSCFLRKEKFRVQLSRKVVSVKALEETVR